MQLVRSARHVRILRVVDFAAKSQPRLELGEFGPLSTQKRSPGESAAKSKPGKSLEISKNMILAAAWSR
jgi:hypothetical protein